MHRRSPADSQILRHHESKNTLGRGRPKDPALRHETAHGQQRWHLVRDAGSVRIAIVYCNRKRLILSTLPRSKGTCIFFRCDQLVVARHGLLKPIIRDPRAYAYQGEYCVKRLSPPAFGDYDHGHLLDR